MPQPLTIKEIQAHPALPNIIVLQEPTAKGTATVAKGRIAGPLDMAYEVHGTGPIHIVWIMGLNATKIAWRRQMNYFGHENGDRFTNLIFDNRGVGDSGIPWARYTTSEMARDVLDLVDHLGWTEERQLHIVGVSMGGMIAQELAYLAPQRIAALCLQSTAARLTITLPYHVHFFRRFTMILPKTLERWLANAKVFLFSSEFMEAPDAEGVFPTNGDRYAAEEIWKMKELKQPPARGFLLQGLAATWHNVSAERLKKIGEGIPRILVCVGSVDKMIEPLHSDVLVEGLQKGGAAVQKRIFDGAGHALNWERMAEYNAMLVEFFTSAHQSYTQ